MSKLINQEVEATYKDTSGLIYKTIEEMLRKFAPDYTKGLEYGTDDVIVKYFANLEICKETMCVRSIGGMREVAGYSVIFCDHDGDPVVIKKTVSWSEACYEFVVKILENEVRHHLEIVTAIPEDYYA